MKTVEWFYKINEKYDLHETYLELKEAHPHWEIKPVVETHTLYARYEIPDDADPNEHSGIVFDQ